MPVEGYLGRVLSQDGAPLGTCFQIRPGVLVTAWHVLVQAGSDTVDAVVRVDGLPAGGVPAVDARVVLVDPLHDLAVLRRESPLPASTGGLTATDAVTISDRVLVTGHVVVEDPDVPAPRHLDAPGEWAGGTTREDGVALGRVSADAVMPGMSGAPVIRRVDGAVVGVVCARYNSADGWLQHSVWVARTEDLQALLSGWDETRDVELLGLPVLTSAVDVVLKVDRTSVQLQMPDRMVQAPHRGVSFGLVSAVDDVRRARARATVDNHRDPSTAEAPAGGVVAESMRAAGRLLAESFLPEPVAQTLRDVLQAADASSVPVRIGVDVCPEAASWSRLPWEALPDPGTGRPLALHRLVSVYRRTASAGAVRRLAGPLRIVVAIAAPSSGSRGAVLDYEQELRRVLAAVRGARASGAARVEIVQFATVEAIRTALDAGDVHVLHLSGHGAPGTLILENADGAARAVTAREFLDEAIPAGKMPPVICLAACYTNVPDDAEPGAVAASSFAQDLITHGAAAVVATETSVTDGYATRLFSRIYQTLATAATTAASHQAATPDLVEAVAHARRVVQLELETATNPRDQQLAWLDEWGVVSVLAATGSVQVLDPGLPRSHDLAADPSRRTFGGLLGRDPGEFVGRRPEQRQLPTALTGGLVNGVAHHGVMLRGIGGIGKTTLAAEVVRRALEQQPGRLVVTVSGETGVEQILTQAVSDIRRHLVRAGLAGSPQMQALQAVASPELSWPERFQELQEQILDVVPVLLVLDNFEDNLLPDGTGPRRVRDETLADLLTQWLARPGDSRVLITCRYRFTLPDQAENALWDRSLGPLTQAETYKLAWALPHLDALSNEDLEQVWRLVGGHPRTLEYLDALLAKGQGRFPDISAKLRRQVEKTLKDKATSWLKTERDLDAALADAVTVAADDVLLPELLKQISVVPRAREALLGLSVYREPVDRIALLFQIGDPDESAAWIPDRDAADERINATLAAHGLDRAKLDEALQNDDLQSLPPDAVTQLMPDLQERYGAPRPPYSTNLNLEELIQVLADSTLLTVDHEAGTLFVHRWTADELARLTSQPTPDQPPAVP